MSERSAVTDARALAHPLRVSIVLTMAERGNEISPLEIAEELGQGLGVVAYHVRYLHKLGTIELARTQAVRGAYQSFYILASDGTSVLDQAQGTTAKHDLATLGRALMNPLRMRILRELADADDDLSPRQLSERLGKPLGTVAYHTRYLHKLDYIELARTEPVRGALAHYYRLSQAMREFVPIAEHIAA